MFWLLYEVQKYLVTLFFIFSQIIADNFFKRLWKIIVYFGFIKKYNFLINQKIFFLDTYFSRIKHCQWEPFFNNMHYILLLSNLLQYFYLIETISTSVSSMQQIWLTTRPNVNVTPVCELPFFVSRNSPPLVYALW